MKFIREPRDRIEKVLWEINMHMMKQVSSIATLADSDCTNILVGQTDINWLLFYLGGKSNAISPYTDMEKHNKGLIYFTEFDDLELKGWSEPADTKRLVFYNNPPKSERPFKRWTADYIYGFRPRGIVSFAWKDVIVGRGAHAQLLATRVDPAKSDLWCLEYRSNAGKDGMAEHERMMELFFSAIVGDTFQIKKLDSPFPASHVAG